jgi:glycine betaine/choline ABC-type transport system substrate-binding protein
VLTEGLTEAGGAGLGEAITLGTDEVVVHELEEASVGICWLEFGGEGATATEEADDAAWEDGAAALEDVG